jgi:hypothetical protein
MAFRGSGGACIAAEDRAVIYEPVSDSDFGIRAADHILLATVFFVRVCCYAARTGLLARYSVESVR